MDLKQGNQNLLSSWNDVLLSIDKLSRNLRRVAGCRDTVITICIRNGARLDTYSFPEDVPLPGMPTLSTLRKDISYDQMIVESPRERIELSYVSNETEYTPKNISQDKSIYFPEEIKGTELVESILQRMNAKEIKALLTKVRQRLNLNSFKWPELAKTRFSGLTNEPIPTRPGRANSTMKTLKLMLQLSMECDPNWSQAATEELKIYHSRSLDLSGDTNEENRVKDEAMKDQSMSEELSEDIETIEEDKPFPFNQNTGDTDSPFKDKLEVDEELAQIINHVKTLPKDSMRVSICKNRWVPLERLMAAVIHPKVTYGCSWYIQKTPGDGNCMFSSILTAASNRTNITSNLHSVSDLRGMLKHHLEQLSNAGKPTSQYRREYLAACMFDVEDRKLRKYCENALETALQTCESTDIENFLLPLRRYVSNWAKMVGESHWGGLLQVELSIIASIMNAVIEVLGTGGSCQTDGEDQNALQMCDTRNGNKKVHLHRTSLHYPIHSYLHSVDQKFLGPTPDANTHSGWVGTYPVLRVVLNRKHYDACTSSHVNPVHPPTDNSSYLPSSTMFLLRYTLVEPYSSLGAREESYFEKAQDLITDWRDAAQKSYGTGRHADAVVMHTKCTELTVSNLSHLEIPPPIIVDKSQFMMSDEIMTCYMYLLERRTENLTADSLARRTQPPPKSRFMDSWFYKSISRGLSGPTSQRKRGDLSSFSILVIPALVQAHWVLAVCYPNEHVIGVYDPTNSSRQDVFQVIKVWASIQLHKGDEGDWTYMHLQEAGGCIQHGDIDCGIYVCKAAEALGLGFPVRISQWDIEYVRKRMMVELFCQQATKITWPPSFM